MTPVLGKRHNRYLKRVSAVLKVWDRLSLPGHRSLADYFWARLVRRLEQEDEPLFRIVKLPEPAQAVSGAEPEKDAWEDLKLRTYIASRCENHVYYEACLERYDPALKFLRQGADGHATFFGSGHGESTLNCYRKILSGTAGGPVMFEKVYSTQFDDVFRIEWLESNFGELLRSRGVLLPEILSLNHGARAVAVYSRFMAAGRIPQKEAVSRAVAIIRVLMDVSSVPSIPEYQDYQSQHIYCQALASARALVTRLRPEANAVLDRITGQVAETPQRYLTHGDLHYKNMLGNGAVLDWDSCGFYPFGYDLGLALSKSLPVSGGESLVAEIQRHFDLDALGNRAQLQMCSLFFCFLFYSRKSSLKLEDGVIIDIFDHLVTVHQRVANDHS
ncbi:phosphotransferase [Marinobacter sp.]|uniref:phosphotransferase n=1 Tax=Marinobacter sp. TaxID=50741 RepID=UPI00384B7A8F